MTCLFRWKIEYPQQLNGVPARTYDVADVATRLRELREAKPLSQRALAKSASISNATLSLIESHTS